MTNGGMYYSADGDSMKRFHVHDGMGLQLLKAKGVKVGIITSEDNQIVRKRFEKLRLDFLVQGKRNEGKLAAAKSICDDMGIDLSEVAYIGDDINCRELLQHVGLAACPADAMDVIKSIPGIVLLKKKGGEGCVREFVELIIKHNEE
jgi:YrbI family 3-deoxy-D-manno-octulosonate 8-phosphate phosphatase